LKTFIIESPNPNDLLDERNEAGSLVNICRMFSHKATSFLVKSKDGFTEAIDYICDIELEDKDLLCLHLSCHGNEDGLAFGKDFINWGQLGTCLMGFISESRFRNKYILVISACGANDQNLTKKLSRLDKNLRNKIAPPSYVFVYDETEVPWKDALLSWTILYHQLSNLKSLDKDEVQLILGNIKSGHFGKLMYFRWDFGTQKYMRFRPQDKSKDAEV